MKEIEKKLTITMVARIAVAIYMEADDKDSKEIEMKL